MEDGPVDDQVATDTTRGALGGEAFFWSIVDAAPDAIVVVGPDGRIRMVNDQVQEIFGYRRRELIDRHVEDLIPDQHRDTHRGHRAGYQTDPRLREMGAGLELAARRADGSEFPVEVSLSPVRSGGETYVVAAVRNIADRVEADRLLREQERALAEAERALAVADDRERIAQDLHDKVIQRLFAAGLSLQSIVGSVEGPVAERLATITDELDETIREVHTSIFSLQTVGRSPTGLRGRILDVVAQERAALGFEPRLGFDGRVDAIDSTVADHVLAVLREALSNVARHANAGGVHVSVAVGDEVVLTVTDDGIGIPEQTAGGRGISNMANRAQSLNGACVLAKTDGGGTRLEWRVPANPPL